MATMIDVPMIDTASDREWHRQQAALKQIDPGEVLAVIDEMIAQRADPQQHPLYGLVVYLLDRSNSPGSPIALFERVTAMAQTAIDACVDDILTDPSAWEED